MTTVPIKLTLALKGGESGYRSLSVGVHLLLQPEPSNPTDPHAIYATLMDGSRAGYIANSPNTVQSGTMSATDIHGKISQPTEAVIVQETSYTKSNGTRGKAFIVEFIPIGEVRPMAKKVLEIKLVGSRSAYPKKTDLIAAVRRNENPVVVLEKKNGRIEALFENSPAGYVEKPTDGSGTYAELEALLNPNLMATIFEVINNGLNGKVEVDEDAFNQVSNIRSLKAVCAQLIEDNLATAAEIEERISYLESCGVTEKAMVNLFSTYRAYEPDYAALIPNPPETIYVDTDKIVKRCVAYVNESRNLLFEGDKGTGKNVLTETLAWLYKRPLVEFSINSQHDNTSLLGGKTIESDEDGKMKTGFDLELTIQAGIHGCFLVFDEFNTGITNALSIFNSYLDDRRRITVPGYGVVKAHSNFCAISTQNVDYMGTFENNEATIERFVPILFPHASSIKGILAVKVPDAGIDAIDKCDKLYKGVLDNVHKSDVSDKAITIRGYIDALRALRQDLTLKEALIDNVVNRCRDKDDRKKVLNNLNLVV